MQCQFDFRFLIEVITVQIKKTCTIQYYTHFVCVLTHNNFLGVCNGLLYDYEREWRATNGSVFQDYIYY